MLRTKTNRKRYLVNARHQERVNNAIHITLWNVAHFLDHNKAVIWIE